MCITCTSIVCEVYNSKGPLEVQSTTYTKSAVRATVDIMNRGKNLGLATKIANASRRRVSAIQNFGLRLS